MTPSTYPIKRALVSVSDKTGLVEFAHALAAQGVEIISTGGTATTLKQSGVPVRSVSEVTGFAEILDGRVKTLHPAIHAGLLAVLDNPEHQRQLHKLGIASIDLVVVNLYPFEQTLDQALQQVLQQAGEFDAEGSNGIASLSDAQHNEIVENIDIGGPAMIRAAAKNYRWTAVVTNPARYNAVLEAMKVHEGALPETLRQELACEAFQHTAYYDSIIARYFQEVTSKGISKQMLKLKHPADEGTGSRDDGHSGDAEVFPATMSIALRRAQPLRYGENPHQAAALYNVQGTGVRYDAIYKQLHGKELSYNNILDIDGAARLALEFTGAQHLPSGYETVVIIKHTNPCGVGSAPTLEEAYQRAYQCDTTSAFGGIIACTAPIDRTTAQTMDELFTEVLIAPAYTPEALEVLQKKKNRRLMTVDYEALRRSLALELKAIGGGILVQEADMLLWSAEHMKVVTKRTPTSDEQQALEYAWRIAKHVKSNAVVYASAHQALAIGAGQMSRVDSAAIAARKAEKAGINLHGSAVASDAFFPFADGLLEAVQAGATAVIQPGGSVRDAEVIAAADERGIAMVFTGMRHFKH